jgi:DNA-binding NarL/FixJ family response regulator
MYILLADDHYDVRQGFECLLCDEPDLHLAGEATSATDLIDQLSSACPDVVLLDWELPGRSAELLTRICEVCPSARVIALSVRPESCEEALQLGVNGFISKGDPPERVIATVREVCCA